MTEQILIFQLFKEQAPELQWVEIYIYLDLTRKQNKKINAVFVKIKPVNFHHKSKPCRSIRPVTGRQRIQPGMATSLGFVH